MDKNGSPLISCHNPAAIEAVLRVQVAPNILLHFQGVDQQEVCPQLGGPVPASGQDVLTILAVCLG